MTKKTYIYSWWSGCRIEKEHSKINKIKGNKIYFYNNYCQEKQQADIRDCRQKNNYYICEKIQY
jgi:hypothetical protein